MKQMKITQWVTLMISILSLIISLSLLAKIEIHTQHTTIQPQVQTIDHETRIKSLENALHVHEGIPD